MHPLRADSAFATITVYGDSGVGKTRLAGTATPPVLILNRDNGLMSLQHLKQYKDVMVEDINSSVDLEAALKNLRGVGEHDWRKFKTVVLDDLPSIQDMIMTELGEKAAERDDRRQLDEAQQRDYGVMGTRMRRYVRVLKTIPMHKVFVCQMAPDKDTGMIKPGLLGAMRHQLPHLCDAIIYMRMGAAPEKGKPVTRMLYLEGTDEFLAKTRAWWLPTRIKITANEERATLATLFTLIARGPQGRTQPTPKSEA